jgi:hypothetical protein
MKLSEETKQTIINWLIGLLLLGGFLLGAYFDAQTLEKINF